MSIIWIIGWLFTVGWHIATHNENTVLMNWIDAVIDLILWPISLGYEIRKMLP